MNPSPETLDRLASEYVLGTLHGGARRRFQRMMRERPQVAQVVREWEGRLMPLGQSLDGPAPRAALWQSIEAQIAPAAAQSSRGGSPVSWLARLFGLPGWSMLAAGIVLGGALGLALPMLRETLSGPQQRASSQLPESYAGFLADAGGATAALVSSLRHGTLVDVKLLRPVSLAAGERLHLWALAPGAAPRWLGPLPAEGKAQLRLPESAERLLSSVTELAVSVERIDDPAVPAQPFRLRGPCARFW